MRAFFPPTPGPTGCGWPRRGRSRTPSTTGPIRTHYSYALRDAVVITTEAGVQVIEVHISNPQAREEFRHTSVLSGVVTGTIAGLGTNGYLLALAHLTGGARRPPLG